MTTETKFTPGPWSLDNNDVRDEAQAVLRDATGCIVADVFTGFHLAHEHEANAHLIAAAPELYEALQKMVKMASTGMVDFNPHDEFVMSSARAALAKAWGES